MPVSDDALQLLLSQVPLKEVVTGLAPVVPCGSQVVNALTSLASRETNRHRPADTDLNALWEWFFTIRIPEFSVCDCSFLRSLHKMAATIL